MPKFAAIGYGDRAGYDRTASAVRTAAHAFDDHLKQHEAVIGIAGNPVQVRNPDDTGKRTTDTASMSAALPVAGFSLMEAADIAQAIKLVSHIPCAVAHGVVEVWPIGES